jgi:uncharacterized protein YjbJ (UPF0337 family)
MTTDRIKGKAQQASGKAKEKIGQATGNERLRDEGTADQIEGKGREMVGKGKDAAKKVADKVK